MAKSFRVWEYRVSHSQLLIRSCGIFDKHPDDGNVDLIFGAVFYLHFDKLNHHFHLEEFEPSAFLASEEDVNAAPGYNLTEAGRRHGALYLIADSLHRGYIGAGYLRIERNNLEPMQSSLNGLPID